MKKIKILMKGENKMAEKNIDTRIVHKHDLEVNWNKAVNFIPKQGELIVYDVDDSYVYERLKIGDGKTVVGQLPFVETASSDVDSTMLNLMLEEVLV